MKHGRNPTEASISENKDMVIWESSQWIAMMDRYPIVEGHALILPKKHVSHITDLDEAQSKSMGDAIRQVSLMLKQTYGQGLLVSIKCGKGSARTISHLHIHLIPRKNGDRLWDGNRSRIVLDRTSGFKRLDVTEDELRSEAKKIRGDL